MAFTTKQLEEINEAGEYFLQVRRPPVEIRPQLDLAYRIEGQSVMVYSIRPIWNKPTEFMEIPVAKATFVKTQNHWKVFWQRADMKWYGFSPVPEVKTIKAFFTLVDEDPSGCFWG